MKRFMFASVVAGALVIGGGEMAHAKKPAQTDVQKALTEAYPDAKTEISGTRDVNGVKVSQVKVATKDGESTAEITEHGDFLLYGVPRKDKSLSPGLVSIVQGIFKAAPKDVDMYRVTNYYVDFMGQHKQPYRARFDAVGRLKDISSSAEMRREGVGNREKASKENATKAEGFAKKYLPDAQVQGVYKSEGNDDFFYVDTLGGELIVNKEGQVYSFREEIKKEELPKPVLSTIEKMFNADNISRAYRGEFEYFQFDETTPSGEQVVVKMRPNGDIVEVRNDQAAADDAAMAASHKEGGAKPAAKVGPQPTKAKKAK